jgi:hypothetical protein
LWLKRVTTTPPPAQPHGGEGGRGDASTTALKICLIKRELHLNYHQKRIKITFLMKTSETKKFVKIFCEACLTSTKDFASTIQDLFSLLQKILFKFSSSDN